MSVCGTPTSSGSSLRESTRWRRPTTRMSTPRLCTDRRAPVPVTAARRGIERGVLPFHVAAGPRFGWVPARRSCSPARNSTRSQSRPGPLPGGRSARPVSARARLASFRWPGVRLLSASMSCAVRACRSRCRSSRSESSSSCWLDLPADADIPISPRVGSSPALGGWIPASACENIVYDHRDHIIDIGDIL